MKINLSHRLFTEDPYKAFALRHNTTPTLWREMFDNRYVWHSYEIPILCEYFKLKTKMDINDRTIRRWIKRTQLYKHAQHAIKKGAKEVSYTYFDRFVTEKELLEFLKQDICHSNEEPQKKPSQKISVKKSKQGNQKSKLSPLRYQKQVKESK